MPSHHTPGLLFHSVHTVVIELLTLTGQEGSVDFAINGADLAHGLTLLRCSY